MTMRNTGLPGINFNPTRRQLLAAMGLGAAGIAASGLAGCSPQETTESSPAAESAGQAAGSDALSATPVVVDPIADEDISSEESADIVVIGAGTAGLVCAVAAAEEGASVILLSKDEGPSAQGGSNFAINTKVTKELGIEFDVQDAVRHELQTQNYLASEGQWQIFVRESGAAIDWLADLMEPHGLSVNVEVPALAQARGVLAEYPGSHVFYGGPNDEGFGDQIDVVNALVDILTNEYGQKVLFNTTAVQLAREDGNGRVTSVVAQSQGGEYVRYTGTKAVVLATGDYGNNPAMIAQYCPIAEGLSCMKQPQSNTGDGHLMALQIGAAMQKLPSHSAMIFGSFQYRNLSVNKYGKRFMSELQSNGYSGMQAFMQDDKFYYQIWDGDFANHYQDPPMRYGDPEATPETQQAAFEATVENGMAVKADTLEELAGLIEIDAAALQRTVDRYNELCEAGEDEDFGKDPEVLTPVKTAPFYAQKVTPNLLVTLGGLDVTDDMEVRDESHNVIEGLYALGAIAGNFFGGPYTTYFAGINMGRCVCFGYRLGKQLVQ